MSVDAETKDLSEPDEPRRPAALTRKRISRRVLIDRLAGRVVTLGGLAIIASILAIFFVIAAEAYPLFKSPSATLAGSVAADGGSPPLAIGVDEYREVAYAITESGIQFRSVKDGKSIDAPGFPPLDDAKIIATSALGRGTIALGLSDGLVIRAEVRFVVSYADSGRTITPDVTAGEPIQVAAEGQTIRAVGYVDSPDGPITVAAVGPTELVIVSVREKKALIGKPKREESRQEISLPIDGEITAILLDGRGDDLFVGTSRGQVVRVDLRERTDPRVGRPLSASSQPLAAVTAMGFLIGDRTVVVGDSAGGVSSWQLLLDEDGERRLTKVYDFPKCDGGIVSLSASARDKGFVAADSSVTIHLFYGTTGSEQITVTSASTDVRAAILAPKANGIFAVAAGGEISHWDLSNPHPEISLRSLFGKLWYEGYEQPEYVWQSTGGTDDFEAKFSLTPLIFGTLKGTLYALLFAVPIALLAALYASQFMHPDIKRYVKPTVEIMAALPSVVLGFIAGLWLAPMMEHIVPGIFLMPVVVPTLILLALTVWQLTPTRLRGRFRLGTEIFLLVPVVCIGGALAFYIGSLLESSLLAGDYRNWLLERVGMTYDQRNSLVVGFAMGFAVIPIIFTIAEDSLSNVPQHLVAGSLALGANRWQTAVRVILPTASPGIFSAVMIGFGRAVGETMIVLMATGNTPVMEWSIFNGFRALSANIAVELPEAPAGGTLYRVLFLAALLLFAMTFLVNTAAELVRLRLRKKYRYL
jgi:phosphate transport system permease protein